MVDIGCPSPPWTVESLAVQNDAAVPMPDATVPIARRAVQGTRGDCTDLPIELIVFFSTPGCASPAALAQPSISLLPNLDSEPRRSSRVRGLRSKSEG